MISITKRYFHQLFGYVDLAVDFSQENNEYTVYTCKDDLDIILTLVHVFRSRFIVEFGVQAGLTAKILLTQFSHIQQYEGVDITKGGTVPLAHQQNEIPSNAGRHAMDDNRFHLTLRPRGTRDLSPQKLRGADFIFIDGDHSASGVAYDTEPVSYTHLDVYKRQVKHIQFSDGNFHIASQSGRNWFNRFYTINKNKRLQVSYSCYMRANEIVAAPDLISLFCEIGLNRLFIGIESLVQSDLDFYHKDITVEENIKALDIVEPVSYTHLDVYKRQEHSGTICNNTFLHI